ncbi:MAG: iron-containing redox enzyme family protein [Legionella sp.]|uniref:iron-containing redox enzyme family protein n=1 Tax=Legionella sp. TaxID=459 RepID=UPI0039E3577B
MNSLKNEYYIATSKEQEFQNYNRNELKKIHMFMNKAYHQILFGEKPIDNKLFHEFKKYESSWMASEKSHFLAHYDCSVVVKDESLVRDLLQKHEVFNHPIFDYLMHDASFEELKKFATSESIMNLEFFDYLALAVIGVSDQAKVEIMSNLWDEAGQGSVEKFHTVLFRNFLNDLGITYDRKQILESMSWEGVAGINLFNYFSIYPFNKTKYFGMLAATEMLDPPHYNKLIKGIKRIFSSHNIDHSYYTEHELVDVEHASGWLNQVVIPELARKPYKTQDFWLGFYMRLDSTKKYYDQLLNSLIMKKAA